MNKIKFHSSGVLISILLLALGGLGSACSHKHAQENTASGDQGSTAQAATDQVPVIEAPPATDSSPAPIVEASPGADPNEIPGPPPADNAVASTEAPSEPAATPPSPTAPKLRRHHKHHSAANAAPAPEPTDLTTQDFQNNAAETQAAAAPVTPPPAVTPKPIAPAPAVTTPPIQPPPQAAISRPAPPREPAETKSAEVTEDQPIYMKTPFVAAVAIILLLGLVSIYWNRRSQG